MSGPIKALVALELGVDRHLVEAALPEQSERHVVSVVEGLDEMPVDPELERYECFDWAAHQRAAT